MAIRAILHGMSSEHRQALGDDAPRLLTLADNSCATTQGGLLSPDYKATRQFVDLYINAVSARVVGEYDQALAGYDRALSVPDSATVDAQWRMRAQEGAADALLHDTPTRKRDLMMAQTRLDALKSLREADNLKRKADNRFVFEGITQLKLMCLAGRPAPEVAAKLSGLRSDFDAYAQTRPTPDLKAYAAADRKFIEQDAELYQFCAYAKLRPQRL